MKRIVFLLSVICLLTGCSVTRIDNKPVESVITTMLSQKLKYTNVVGKGYEYYLPMGVQRQSIDEFNEKLYSNGDTYYLFIDVVGYLNKSKIIVPKDKGTYFYKVLDDKGYVSINEVQKKYYIKFYYNYSYIEAQVSKENLNTSIADMISILSTVKYSSNILSYGKANDIVSGYEEKYNISTIDSKDEINFLDWEQYDKYDGPDPDITNGSENKTTDLESDIITRDNNE